MLNTDIQYFKIYNIGNRQKFKFGLLACFLGVFMQGHFKGQYDKINFWTINVSFSWSLLIVSLIDLLWDGSVRIFCFLSFFDFNYY